MLAGVRPPWLERLPMEVGSVPVVVEPQTEAGTGQSKRPDLGVLSMAPDRCGQPLASQMVGDLAVGPGERVVTVADHLERLVPPIGRAGALLTIERMPSNTSRKPL